jgi:hypothetical protein
VKGSFEHGNELSGSIQFWGVPEQLRDWRLLKDSAPCSYFNTYQLYGLHYCSCVSEISSLKRKHSVGRLEKCTTYNVALG